MNPIISNRQFLKELKNNQYFDFKSEFDLEIHSRLIYWGVKSLSDRGDNDQGKDSLHDSLNLYQFVMDMLSKITPRELMNIHPVTKVYDGEKYGVKDYFYTMKKCKEHGMDKPIGNAFEFLWDYMNTDTGLFLVRYLSILSDIRKIETGQGVLETYAAEVGLKTYKEKQINGEIVFVENLTFNSKGELL